MVPIFNCTGKKTLNLKIITRVIRGETQYSYYYGITDDSDHRMLCEP